MEQPLPPPHNTTLPLHPYFPLDASIPNYTANTWPVPTLLALFFGACTLLFTTTYHLVQTLNPHLPTHDLATLLWFVLSGAIHLIFEGYYTLHSATLATDQNPLGQMWKEYALSDSRYLTRDSTVLCMEGLTAAFWGPGCFLVAALILRRHSLRFPVQMIVSVGQFYGDAIYYATSIFDFYARGTTYSRPEVGYFWGYFVLMNLFWLVIPGVLVYQGVVETARAVERVQRMDEGKKQR